MNDIKGIKRDKKKANSRKMKVTGIGNRLIQSIINNKSKKARDAN